MWDSSTLGFAVVALGAIVFYNWRRSEHARDMVDDWARRHRYRLRRCERARFAMTPSAPPSRRGLLVATRSQRPIVFRVDVDDLALGGTGVAEVRCWVAWPGVTDDELEVDWDKVPSGDAGASPAAGPARWADAQLALLRRVAAGETTFRPASRREPDAGAEFDELVEHLLALQRRGLLSFPSPIASRSGGASQYAAVTNVELTPEGQRAAGAA